MRKLIHSVSIAAIASLGASAAMAQDGWPQSMTVATASPGGVYAVYGQGIASIVSDAVGVPTSTQQTQGPGQNVVLVNNNQTELGMTTMGPAWQGWYGELELSMGTEFRDFRALFPMYRTPFQMIALSASGISSLSDLDGKTVGMAPRAGTGGTYWPIWLEQMGINVSAQFGPASDQGGQLGDGRLDAITMAGGVPHPMMSEVEATHDVNIFGLTDEEIEFILDANPYVQAFDIPQEMYQSVDEDVPSVAMWNIAIANKDMPDDLAYAIVEAIFDNHERLVTVHASAVETLLENVAANDTIPYHPGAVQYFRDQGIEVPEAVLPEEMRN